MKIFKLGVYAITLLALTGCPEDNDKKTGNTGGNNCNQALISDYNSASLACQSYYTSWGEENCHDAIDTFVNNHPRVNCKAVNLSTGNKMTISTQQVLDMSPTYGSKGGSGTKAKKPVPKVESIKYKYGDNCSQIVITEYNSANSTCDYAIKYPSSDPSHYSSCKSKLDNLLKSYPGLYCKARSADYFSTKYLKESDVKSTLDSVNQLIELLKDPASEDSESDSSEVVDSF